MLGAGCAHSKIPIICVIQSRGAEHTEPATVTRRAKRGQWEYSFCLVSQNRNKIEGFWFKQIPLTFIETAMRTTTDREGVREEGLHIMTKYTSGSEKQSRQTKRGQPVCELKRTLCVMTHNLFNSELERRVRAHTG